jgi:hypothetical protein
MPWRAQPFHQRARHRRLAAEQMRAAGDVQHQRGGRVRLHLRREIQRQPAQPRQQRGIGGGSCGSAARSGTQARASARVMPFSSPSAAAGADSAITRSAERCCATSAKTAPVSGAALSAGSHGINSAK